MIRLARMMVCPRFVLESILILCGCTKGACSRAWRVVHREDSGIISCLLSTAAYCRHDDIGGIALVTIQLVMRGACLFEGDAPVAASTR